MCPSAVSETRAAVSSSKIVVSDATDIEFGHNTLGVLVMVFTDLPTVAFYNRSKASSIYSASSSSMHGAYFLLL